MMQVQNHNLQWYLLAPPPVGGGQPVGSLGVAIQKQVRPRTPDYS